MDDSQQKELFGRLEETVNAWLGQFSDAHRALADQSSKIKEILETQSAGIGKHREGAKDLAQRLMADLKTLREALSGQQDMGRRVGELEGALEKVKAEAEELRGRQPSLESDLAKARGTAERAENRALEMDRLRSESQARADQLSAVLEKANANEKALTLDLEVTLGDLTKVREEKDALGSVKQEVEELGRLLDTERRRCGELEQKLREETTKKAKSALAQQLAEALRESEAAQEEIQKVRAELIDIRAARKDPPAAPPVPRAEAPSRKKRPTKGKGEAKGSLAEILVEAGIVTQRQIDEALENERATPQHHLGVILVEKGLASEKDIAQAIAVFCDAECVRLDDATLHDEEAVRLLSARLARLHTCLPVRVDGNKLVLAMANPLDLVAIEDIERTTNLTVQPVVAAPSEILQAIAQCYVEESKSEGAN